MNIKKLYITVSAIIMLILSACSKGTADEISASATDASEIITSTSAVTTTAETTVTETTASETESDIPTDTSVETTSVTETTSNYESTEIVTTNSSGITATSETTSTETTATEKVTAATSAETKETTAATEAISPVMEQYLDISDRIDEYFADIVEDRDFPVVHILTYNNEQITSKEVYNDTVIDVFNCDEKYRLTAEGGVKVRGNSSANDTVLPYRIKFNEKQNMLGLHDGKEYKSWVLLKSNWNLIPDFMALSLAREIFRGEYYSSDCTYVNVYINGEFKGIYLLCEHTQAADDRVDIYEPKEGETHTDIGYLIELDNYAGEDPDEPCFFMDYGKIEYTDILGETRAVAEDGYTIKSDTFSDEQRAFIEKYYNGIFKICYEGIENNRAMKFDKNYNVVSAGNISPQEAIEAVVDTKSLANMLILEELVHNYDVGAGSFFMAVDFSDTSKYKRLTFLAPWDFNWAYEGSGTGVYYASTFQKPVHDMVERSNFWLIMFMKADWFQDIVKDKWNELQADNSLNDVVYAVCNTAAELEHDLGEKESWRINSASDIAYFVDDRIIWLNSIWGNDAAK